MYLRPIYRIGVLLISIQDTLKESVGCAYTERQNAFVPMTRYEFDAESDMDMYVYSKDSRDHVGMIVDGDLQGIEWVICYRTAVTCRPRKEKDNMSG